MGKKIIFKTASMIRNQQEKTIPEDITKKIDDWIKSSSQENNPSETEVKTENKHLNPPAVQDRRTVRLNLNISADIHKKIKKACVDKGLSITDFVTQLLENELEIK
jgi:ribosome-binding protein aMBF1 (putative translation factor)